MSGSLRRHLMVGIVLGVLVWPIAHIRFVEEFRLDAWEFFGWSMYARPAARVQVRVDVERNGNRTRLRAMGVMRERILAFARRATVLGSLTSSEPLARTILDEDGTVDAVIVVTRDVTLDPISTMLVAREEEHRYVRQGIEEPRS